MLRPFLIIGVGGSGGKTLRAVRSALDMKLRLSGWDHGLPAAWQFLHFDTPLAQDGKEFPAPFLPQDAYVGLSAAHGSYSNVATAIEAQVGKDYLDQVLRQLPNPTEVSVPVQKGAGQYRAVGRAVALSRLKQIADSAKLSLAKMTAADSVATLARLSDHLGGDPNQGAGSNPVLMVVSSIAGGSGAGQYLDIIDAVKAAIGNEPWADESFGILYAPDVFDGVSGVAGIASNALATISESTGGNWNKNTSEAVKALFAGQGLTVSTGGANDRIGVRYPLIVGRQGATTAFKGQHDVYLSIASTLAAWMSEESFQDSIGAYIQGNWAANNNPSVLKNDSGFSQNPNNTPPFSAIGFGRITLAREKFVEYSKERFARSAIDRLLLAHVIDQNDPQFERNDNDGYIRESVNNLRIPFFQDSGFDEETEDHDQVIDQMRAQGELDSLRQQFIMRVSDEVANSLDKKTGGLDANQWVEQLDYARNALVAEYLDADSKNRRKLFDDWVAKAPKTLLDCVSRYAIEYGLPVTERLIYELGLSVDRAASELETESARHAEAVTFLKSYLTGDMAKAGQAAAIRPGSDAVNSALAHVGDSLAWESESLLRRDAASVLREAKKDFIEPLRVFIASTLKALQDRAESDRTADGRDNDFKKWPGFDSQEVPVKYQPSSNEKMLLEASDFPKEFENLIKMTLDLPDFLPAFRNAMRGVLTEDPERDLVPLIAFTDPWVPSTTVGVGGVRPVAQKPRFVMPNDPEAYLERAEKWMKKPGTAFGGFLSITIKEFLDNKTLSPDVYNKRKEKFLAHLRAAFSASSPLVKLNGTLLNQIHGKAVGENDAVIMTPIPFTTDSDMYEPTKQVLMSLMPNAASAEAQVSRSFSDKPETSIEFFQVMGHGVLPMVMNSVMAPIASDWAQVSSNESSRTAFWQWKRARILTEAVPLDEEALSALIAGWYVARAFAQIQRGGNEELGPKLAVKDKDGTSLVFPHPLLYAGRLQEFDYLGAVVESSIIVQAIVNSTSSLEPLKPYQRLIELGGKPRSLSPEVEEWLGKGTPLATTKESASISNSPEATISAENRKNILRDYIKGEMDSLDIGILKLRETSNVYEMPVVWELLPSIKLAVNALLHNVNAYVPPVAGVFEEID